MNQTLIFLLEHDTHLCQPVNIGVQLEALPDKPHPLVFKLLHLLPKPSLHLLQGPYKEMASGYSQ
jgi:hypothetical protein